MIRLAQHTDGRLALEGTAEQFGLGLHGEAADECGNVRLAINPEISGTLYLGQGALTLEIINVLHGGSASNAAWGAFREGMALGRRRRAVHLLYFWRGENCRRDLDHGVGFHLNQSNPLLHQIGIGKSLWAFTRKLDGRYALATELVVSAKTLNPRGFRYGPYRVWGDLSSAK